GALLPVWVWHHGAVDPANHHARVRRRLPHTYSRKTVSRGDLQADSVASLRDHGAAMMNALRAAGGTGAGLSARCAGPRGTRPPAVGRAAHQRADGEGARARAGRLPGQDPLRAPGPDDKVNNA